MSSDEQNLPPGDEPGDLTTVGTSDFDHPNVKLMDRMLAVTVNNERLFDTFIPSKEMTLRQLQVEEMALMEYIYAGEVDLKTSRAIDAASFTIQVGTLGQARDGLHLRMKHSQFNYEVMMPVKKTGGFLSRVFNRGQEESPVYQAERGSR